MKTENLQILFVCTGNYYRSRYAEAVFNHLIQKVDLPFGAISRGLKADTPHEPMEISPLVVQALRAESVPIDARFPLQIQETDLRASALVVLLDEVEHRPMMAEFFPEWEDRVTYLRVPDRVAPEILPAIRTAVAGLIAQVEALGALNANAKKAATPRNTKATT